MSRYSRLFLHFMHAVTNDRDRVYTFLFGTRLTNITRYLRYKDVDVALDKVAGAVEDWSGGTRIGQTLAEFNRRWSRRVLGQGAIVLLITDGLDRDAGAGIGAEMDRLHKSCRRLIWLNPLLRYEGFAPKSLGMRAILPHVDEFRPVHNLESLDELVTALSRPGPRRLEGGGGLARRRGEAWATTSEILQQAADWRAAGKGVALATVVTTWGSSPRPVGAKLVVDQDGSFLGSVSGGCVEGAVIEEALQAHQRRQAAALEFRRQQRAGLGSGPRLRRQDPGLRRARRMKLAFLERALGREPRGHAPRRSPPTSRPAGRASSTARRRQGDLALDDALLDGGATARWPTTAARRSRRRTGPVFIEVFNPRLRCFIVGAVHIAQPWRDGGAGRLSRHRRSIRAAPSPAASAFPASSCRPNGRTRRCSGCKPEPAHRGRDPDPRPQARRSRRWPRRCAPTPSISARWARKKTHAARLRRLAELGFGDGRFRPHPRAGRARYRRRLAGRDRGFDHGADHPGAARASGARKRGRGMKFGETPLAEARGRDPRP